jgi:hypothetical protein
MNASDEEVPLEEGPWTPEEDEVNDVLESLRRHFADEARASREREQQLTPLQQEHIKWRAAYRERLAAEAEAYFRAHPEAQAQDGEAEQTGE